jgi:saccharopine dehydrogenase-like NADP-dependent oxidoreductase
MQITVLGAGLVGNAIVRDLALDNLFDVIAVDRDQHALNRLQQKCSAQILPADLAEAGRVGEIVIESDLVINAVPGFMGFKTLKQVIAAGKNVVDISFFAQDAFQLDEQAKSKGVTAVVDCGVAPGLCNILCGRVANRLDRIEHYTCYVGGLPVIRRWPYEYKSVFSPADVIEEYTRPCRLLEYGREVVRPALSDVELIDFPEIGTLEAFNTDGLRTLRQTMKIPNMREKTLRYPGHANLMRAFRESGFFGPAPVQVDGRSVRPLSVISALLFDQWKLQPGEEDFTLMKVVVDGWDKESKRRYTYDLLDRYDRKTQTTSMARTTGYTCSIVARQILAGKFNMKGICPPELIGRQDACFNDLLAGYNQRNIRLVETIDSPNVA